MNIIESAVREATEQWKLAHPRPAYKRQPVGVTKVGDLRIATSNQYWNWVAVDDDTYDGPGSLIGIGKTEKEAIDDFLQQIQLKEGL